MKKTIKNILTHKCSCVQLDAGDILNRHNLYYRYCEDYMLINNLTKEKQIPDNIKEEFHKKSYKQGKEQGKEWFKNNIDAINQLIPEGYKINKDFQIKDSITILYKGDENNPRIEYICHKYWLENIKYKKIEIILNEICLEKNSIVDRAIKHTTNCFYNLIKNKIKYKNLFLKQSYKYIFDETVSTAIMSNQNNCIEFYCGNEIASIQALSGRKVQNNPIIKKLMERGGLLEGIKKRKFVSVKMVEEEGKNTK